MRQQQADENRKNDELKETISLLSQGKEEMETKCAKYGSSVAKAEEEKREVIVRLSKEETKVKDLAGQLQRNQKYVRSLEEQISEHEGKNELLQQQLEEVETQKQQKEVALNRIERRLKSRVDEIDSLNQRIADLQRECLTLEKAESCTKTRFEEKLQLEQQNTEQLRRHLKEEQGKAAEKEIIIQQLRPQLELAKQKAHVSDENSRTMETELSQYRELMTFEQENHLKCKVEKAALETKLLESESSRHALEKNLETANREHLNAYQEVLERYRRYRNERNDARDELVKLGKLIKYPRSPMLTRKSGSWIMDTDQKSQQKLEGGSARQRTRTAGSGEDMRDPKVLLKQNGKFRPTASETSKGSANHVNGCPAHNQVNATTSLTATPGMHLSLSVLTSISQLSHCDKQNITIGSEVYAHRADGKYGVC